MEKIITKNFERTSRHENSKKILYCSGSKEALRLWYY